MQRAQRKLDHIKYALALEDGPLATHLADLRFIHNCLPELSPADIDLSCEILGKQLRLPFFIDAITGGTKEVARINENLALVARETGCGIACGSEYGAVHKKGTDTTSYEIIRKVNPDGLVLGNVSALATPTEAQAALDILGADGLEIHLNAAQEMFMPEGDRDFSKIFSNIKAIREALDKPVIIKETGCGIAAEEFKKLSEISKIEYFDCAGAGGTNFIAIEAARSSLPALDLLAWGHPTSWSLIDAHESLPKTSRFIASGGLRTGLDLAKAFALGASAVSMAGPILKAVMNGGVAAGVDYINKVTNDLKIIMTLLNVKSITQLKKVPLLIFGDTKDYCLERGYDLAKLSRSR